MNQSQNDLFRFVSVRGPEPVYVAEPTADVPNTAVTRQLRGVDVDLRKVDPQIPPLIAGVGTLSARDLAASPLTGVRDVVDSSLKAGAPWLSSETTLADGVTRIGTFVASPSFLSAYGSLIDSWLVLLLTAPTSPDVPEHVDLLRVGHLVHMLVGSPARSAEPNAFARLRSARLMPPASWLRSTRAADAVAARQAKTLSTRQVITPSARSAELTAARELHRELVDKRRRAESVQRKSEIVYSAWRAARTGAAATRSTKARASAPRASVDNRREVAPTPRKAHPAAALNKTFFEQLDTLLTPEERTLNTELRAGLPQEQTHGQYSVGLAPERWVSEANRLCQQIQIWEDEERSLVGRPVQQPDGAQRPLVRSMGWGDLVVARERLIGYRAREIAHIENVMPGETRRREHERTRTVEVTTERESITESESERDLETTDRYQLQSETQATIQETYSIEAGVNTSGKYGLTQVDTSLQAGLQKGKTEARSSSQTLAKEIVAKAVERTLSRVREVRRETVTEQIRELNTHGLDNLAAGQATPPQDVAGVYLWVEKLMEVELRHYGTRLLVEFHIPEPGISLLDPREPTGQRPRKPAEFRLSPSGVLPENYLCLTQRYKAQDVEPPPPHQIQVGYSWGSSLDESADGDAQDARADLIAIPAGYRPLAMTALVSAHPGKTTNTDVFMAMAGVPVVEMTGANYGESGQAAGDAANVGGPVEIAFDPSTTWPGGVPVVIRAVGHYDGTMVAEATVRCVRTDDALQAWQLRTWERLRSAHEGLLQQYQTELDRQSVESFAPAATRRPESENRRVEDEELRKWAMKAMRLQSFNFDGTVIEADGVAEVNPADGDLVARVAGFFEEAFEWGQASYFLYPYYWGRRQTWSARAQIALDDPRHAAFLRAGAAKFVVPVTPGYEDRVIYYLEGSGSELERLGAPPAGHEPDDPALLNLWLELLLDHRPDLAIGSGTLSVTQGDPEATINPDSTWHATARDLGRELFIGGDVYAVTDVAPFVVGTAQTITLDEPFRGVDDSTALYAAGSVPYGPPWTEHLPTTLVILAGRRALLDALGT